MCGEVETYAHYFLECPGYDEQQSVMVGNLQAFVPLSIPLLLHGDPSLDELSNIAICNDVHCFIKISHRF